MATKNIHLSNEDLLKKLTMVPFIKKDARTGYITTYADDLKLLHQLQVLQLEAGLNNGHRYAHPFNLEDLNRKQTELFEFAPNGYFTLSSDATIQEANLTGANMLGMTRHQLVNQQFTNLISPGDKDIFNLCLFNLFKTNDYQIFKLILIRADGHPVYTRVALSGTWIHNEFHILVALTDVSLWKKVEDAQNFLLGYSWLKSGKDFFQALTDYLAESLEMNYLSVNLFLNSDEAVIVAYYHDNEITLDTTFRIGDSAIGKMMDRKSFCFPNGVCHLFPNDKLLQQLNAESYAGVILWSLEGNMIGFITATSTKPLNEPRLTEMVLKQVSIRAAAEMEHRQLKVPPLNLHANSELQEQINLYKEVNAQLLKENESLKQQVQSIKMSEEKYRTVADHTYNWETWYSPSGESIYVSPSCKRISGYSAEEFMNDPGLLITITHPDDRTMVDDYLSHMIKGEMSASSFEFRIISREGSERWIGHYCQPVFGPMGNFMGLRGSNQDITQRKVAEKILLDSQLHLRQLSQRMDELTEAERTRISHEIHDELGHLLTALKFDMEGLVTQSELTAEGVKTEVEGMIDIVDALIDSVRKIATELRPGILDQLGLFPAIEWQVKQFRLRTKICCVFTMEPMNISFDQNETNIIFRILQEILTNITRHSEAKHVEVSLYMKGSTFAMEVKDNGIGFEVDDLNQVNKLGLIGMKERALSIGGDVSIESHPGKGTKVCFSIQKDE